MSLKQAAEELLKVADEIEQKAAECTQFTCGVCNHTTTLAKINAARKHTASEVGENVTVSDITVNDKVTCPACEGVLAYKETEASAGYYYDPDKAVEAKKDPDAPHSEKTETPEQEAAESLETQKKERAEGKHTASVDYDAIDRYKKG